VKKIWGNNIGRTVVPRPIVSIIGKMCYRLNVLWQL